jgi:CRP-like cAMP-binding protein
MNYYDYFKNHQEYVEFKAGDRIFSKGDESNGKMYAVKSGQVEIAHNGTVLETVEPGHYFGEMSLVDAAPRAADAVAKTDCQIVLVDKYHFLYLTQETPMFALQVMHVMAERIRKLHDRL